MSTKRIFTIEFRLVLFSSLMLLGWQPLFAQTDTYNFTGAQQTWVVPAGVTSTTITASGARGGNVGGNGAQIAGTFAVTPGDTIKILVGGQGTFSRNDNGGGGGGSFVWNNAGDVLFIAAGGGGGRSGNSNGSLGGPGSATNTPTGSINGSGNSAGGSGGSGGTGGIFISPASFPGTGGGGAGWLTDGSTGTGALYNGTGGQRPLAGGAGGVGFNPDFGGQNIFGGFGGGGGAGGQSGASGGGGGYNGGGGGHGWNGFTWGSGGGGGSFNAGTNQSNTAGVNAGNGSVIMTWNAPPSDVVVNPSTNTPNEGSSMSVSGSFTDPNAGDTHMITISWGDGSADTVINLGAGVLTYGPATHTYADGTEARTITVAVADPASSSASSTANITVLNVSPSVTTSVDDDMAVYGQTVTLTGSYSGAPSVDAVASGWTKTNGPPITVPSGDIVNVTFSALGNYEFTYTADDGDLPVTAVVTVTVSPRPITVAMNTAAVPTTLFGATVAALAGTWDKNSVTVTGTAFGEGIDDLDGASITFTSTPAFATPVELTPIGTYSVFPGGLSSSNYAITYVPADLTISRNQRPRRAVTPVVPNQQK